MKNYIVGMGEALWDVLPEGKKIGGAPANFAYHMSQFGYHSIVVSAVGNDPLGDEIVMNFTEKGLQQEIARTSYPTGTVQVTLDEQGIPQYEIKTGVAWDHIPYTPALAAIAAETKAICFGSLAQRNEESRETIHRFLEAMPADSMKVFDINLRQHFYSEALIRRSLQLCTVLKINDEEIVTVGKLFGYSETSLQEIGTRLYEEFGLDLLILTCGAVGSYVYRNGAWNYVETPRVQVADTVGAGDSFTAAFCASLLNGKSVREAHEKAVAVSAFVCTQAGAMPRLPKDMVG